MFHKISVAQFIVFIQSFKKQAVFYTEHKKLLLKERTDILKLNTRLIFFMCVSGMWPFIFNNNRGINNPYNFIFKLQVMVAYTLKGSKFKKKYVYWNRHNILRKTVKQDNIDFLFNPQRKKRGAISMSVASQCLNG